MNWMQHGTCKKKKTVSLSRKCAFHPHFQTPLPENVNTDQVFRRISCGGGSLFRGDMLKKKAAVNNWYFKGCLHAAFSDLY